MSFLRSKKPPFEKTTSSNDKTKVSCTEKQARKIFGTADQNHVDYIIKKACKKLHSVRVPCRARVSQPNIMRIYLSTVRPALEYAVPVWQNIPAYLSEAIERVQKRELNIIYPETESYAHALQLGKLDRLYDRRVLLCYKYIYGENEVPQPPSAPPTSQPTSGRAHLHLKAENTKVLSFPEHTGLQDKKSEGLLYI